MVRHASQNQANECPSHGRGGQFSSQVYVIRGNAKASNILYGMCLLKWPKEVSNILFMSFCIVAQGLPFDSKVCKKVRFHKRIKMLFYPFFSDFNQ